MRLESGLLDSDGRLLGCAQDVQRLKELNAAAVAQLQGVKENVLAHATALQALSATHSTRQAADTERQALRENLRSLQQAVADVLESLHALRLDR